MSLKSLAGCGGVAEDAIWRQGGPVHGPSPNLFLTSGFSLSSLTSHRTSSLDFCWPRYARNGAFHHWGPQLRFVYAVSLDCVRHEPVPLRVLTGIPGIPGNGRGWSSSFRLRSSVISFSGMPSLLLAPMNGDSAIHYWPATAQQGVVPLRGRRPPRRARRVPSQPAARRIFGVPRGRVRRSASTSPQRSTLLLATARKSMPPHRENDYHLARPSYGKGASATRAAQRMWVADTTGTRVCICYARPRLEGGCSKSEPLTTVGATRCAVSLVRLPRLFVSSRSVGKSSAASRFHFVLSNLACVFRYHSSHNPVRLSAVSLFHQRCPLSHQRTSLCIDCFASSCSSLGTKRFSTITPRSHGLVNFSCARSEDFVFCLRPAFSQRHLQSIALFSLFHCETRMWNRSRPSLFCSLFRIRRLRNSLTSLLPYRVRGTS